MEYDLKSKINGKRSVKFIFPFILLFGFLSIVNCQVKPDFSGEWNLNLEKSKLQAFWTEGLTKGNLKIVHEEPKFNLWRSFTIKGKERLLDYTMETNGKEKKGKHRTNWTLSWQQGTLELVIND